jgi:hypothetical protein
MLDLKFIEFYVRSIYNQSMEEYYFVNKSVISGWRHRNFPQKRIKEFIYREKTDNIHELFEKIYPKS